MPKILKEVLKFTVLAGFLVVAQTFAFSEPGVPAPGGTALAPVNVGNSIQEKTAMLAATQLLSRGSAYFATALGNVGIGTESPTQKLHIVGGKAQANDFCLNSDPTKCLTNAAVSTVYLQSGLYGVCYEGQTFDCQGYAGGPFITQSPATCGGASCSCPGGFTKQLVGARNTVGGCSGPCNFEIYQCYKN